MDGVATGDVGTRWTAETLEGRVVRYRDLRPCLNAFIDTRTPGSEAKENFTIIGPGVSENPDQHVHIAEPHGFNIGGARQPANCVNSQHSHDTAEVFVVHTGRWRFDFGENGEDASVEASPGDAVSFPIKAFRGFTNIGSPDDEPGFLWSVLGGDDPGRVTWAPRVFEMARDYGLVLLENGALVDTTRGETPPPGVAPMPPTSREMVESLRRMTPADAEAVIARAPAGPAPGERLLIGEGGALAATDGFTLSRIELAAGDAADGVPTGPEVVFVHRGGAVVDVEGQRVALGQGDTMTVPVGPARRLVSDRGAVLFVVRGT
ncbi:cupin [Sphingomonas lenta]|uniref:Cupin n=1 Tax=Sphingomonas lenta TaxID=1141887 RepID=A0A2A2SEV5_9SPHN|nr:cupin [Sphingomonas lenta]PAX07730.1 cupin [Sphingomonas lenta]